MILYGDRGYGFVEFADALSASEARRELHDTDVFKTGFVSVRPSKPRQDRSRRGSLDEYRSRRDDYGGRSGGGYRG